MDLNHFLLNCWISIMINLKTIKSICMDWLWNLWMLVYFLRYNPKHLCLLRKW